MLLISKAFTPDSILARDNAIPASVIIGRSVQRLVQAVDEVNDESQRVGSLLGTRAWIAKHSSGQQ
jgi:hypothetical protein